MSLLAGLQFYEIVLLGCGVALFAVLLFTFILRAMKGASLGGLFGFFVLPIVMIGFPGIQKIRFEKDKVEIETKAREVRANPSDNSLRQELEEKLENVSVRTSGDPDTSVKLAEGYQALGKTNKGLDWAVKAGQQEPGSSHVKELLVQLSTAQINEALPPQNPTTPPQAVVLDPQRRAQLDRAVEVLKAQPELLPDVRITLAEGQVGLGQTDAAKTTAEQAIKEAPALRATPKAQRVLRSVQ